MSVKGELSSPDAWTENMIDDMNLLRQELRFAESENARLRAVVDAARSWRVAVKEAVNAKDADSWLIAESALCKMLEADDGNAE